MDKQQFSVQGKNVTLYAVEGKGQGAEQIQHAGCSDNLCRPDCPDCFDAPQPLIVLNNYTEDADSVIKAWEQLALKERLAQQPALKEQLTSKQPDRPCFYLLCIGHLNWDHDMTPWYCPPLSAQDVPCTGGADDYLELLLSEILSKAQNLMPAQPSYVGIAGYSLAGLFALYALYRCSAFDCAASMSGSLWFPDFKEFCQSHTFKRAPRKLYISLGDKESKTNNRFLQTVQDNTEAIVEYYQGLGINVEWELNPGNHLKDAALRSAKGINALLAPELSLLR